MATLAVADGSADMRREIQAVKRQVPLRWEFGLVTAADGNLHAVSTPGSDHDIQIRSVQAYDHNGPVLILREPNPEMATIVADSPYRTHST